MPKGQRSRVGRFRSRAGRGGGPVHLSPERCASACGCRLLWSRWLEPLRYSVLPSASFAGWIGGRQPGARTLLRWGSYQPPIRSLLARRRLLAVVADPNATDQNKGTKPVFKGVNPAAATTAGDLRSIQIWLPLVDALRTLLLAPSSEVREILDRPWAHRHVSA